MASAAFARFSAAKTSFFSDTSATAASSAALISSLSFCSAARRRLRSRLTAAGVIGSISSSPLMPGTDGVDGFAMALAATPPSSGDLVIVPGVPQALPGPCFAAAGVAASFVSGAFRTLGLFSASAACLAAAGHASARQNILIPISSRTYRGSAPMSPFFIAVTTAASGPSARPLLLHLL